MRERDLRTDTYSHWVGNEGSREGRGGGGGVRGRERQGDVQKIYK